MARPRVPSGQDIGSWLACHEFEPSTTEDPPYGFKNSKSRCQHLREDVQLKQFCHKAGLFELRIGVMILFDNFGKNGGTRALQNIKNVVVNRER
ncbi:hypothetical protein TNCV_716161 [Trichonephila clavipes]|nr:hypothetical protein TNCV_716161 [Trichonephila clavipes]